MFLIPKDYYQIKKTKKKGTGVFARKHIPAGTIIGDYIGRIVSDKEAEKLEEKFNNACYSFEYVKENTSIFPVDIKAPGVHLINHSCGANCDVYDLEGHNIYFAVRHIFPGEELSFDYGFDPESYSIVDPCFCDSPFCRGTMFARQDKPFIDKKMKTVKKKKEKKEDIKFPVTKVGNILPLLEKYPKEIKDEERFPIYANLEVPALIMPNKELPSLKFMRKTIRLTGRRLKFPRLKVTVLAVVGDHCLSTR